jgi:alpha-glucosidase (family GH31 glycosyl hydrolase)
VHNIDDQFLCGRNILVAPIMREDATRTHYLPTGVWYDFFTKASRSGGQWITEDYSLNRLPVWLKGGSVIPLGPVVQSTSELTEETPLELIALLDENDKASARIQLNRNRISDISVERREEQYVATIGNDFPLRRVRVFTPGGEIAEDNIVLKNSDRSS